MPRRRKVQEEVYHVEVITKARVSEEGEWEYFVKWAGYESDADSWEPTENVKQCHRLLASFWKHVGTDDNDYAIGYEIAAEEDWINMEKRYFRETFVKSSKRKSNNATKKHRQERRESNSNSGTSYKSESAADSDEEEPLEKMPVVKRLNGKARVVDTESESESDRHARKQVKAAPLPKATTPPKEIRKASTTVSRQELPLPTGGSISMAPSKTTVVRTHQDQRTNPLVKSMSLPSKSVEAGSSLSTKQRIAAGIPPPPTGPKPLPLAPKKSLPSLSFKKNKPAIPLSVQTKDVIPSGTSVTTPISPVVQPTIVTNNAIAVASPQPMDLDEPADNWSSMLDDAGPLGGSSDVHHVSTAAIPPKSQEEIDAEKFLQTIDIPVLSGPVDAPLIPDQPDQPTTELVKTVSIPKIPKKWRWSGDLFISTSESKTELLCAVSIADPHGMANTSHINLLLSSLDSLRISKLYPIMDLSPILRACGKPQYFGKLESNEPCEDVIIHGLERHLTSEGLAAAIPLSLDDTEVAVLVIFPGAQQGLTKVLQVPEHLLSGDPLLVVLLPFLVSAMKSTNATGQKSIGAVVQSTPWDVLVPDELPQEAVLYQAMSLLCFPKALLDFLNNPSTIRTYSIWPPPDQLSSGLDTIMLQQILKSTKAVPVKLEEDVRVVFVSRQHLERLHTLPSLVTKLANFPETQFWTYGHSASMTPQDWKVQEIFPLGGIVTFTSSAIAEDLVGCCQLMSQISEHPLWDCYLIPEVVAVSYLLCSEGGHGSSSELCLGPILDLINLGLISVTRMPEMDHSGQLAWLSQVFNHSDISGHELLEFCLGVLRKSHPTTLGMTTEQLTTFINGEISKDLSNAQIQPAFIENYRRFVVIRAGSEDSIPSDKDGLEWSPHSLFNFKDGYFES